MACCLFLMRTLTQSRDSLDRQILLSEEFRVALKGWLDLDVLSQGAQIHPPRPELYLYINTSLAGWGAHLEPVGPECQGIWSRDQINLHINNLELLAIWLAIQSLESHIACHCVMVASDNTTVVSYVRRCGGTLSHSLNQTTRQLLPWCRERHIHVLIRHVPGCLNVTADSLPAIESITSGPSQDPVLRLPGAPNSTEVVPSVLVSPPVGTVSGCSGKTPDSSRPSHSRQRPVLAPRREDTRSSRLDIVRNSVLKKQFSGRIASLIVRARRPSTDKVHDAKWRVFSKWCPTQGANPVCPSTNVVADFLLHIFNVLCSM